MRFFITLLLLSPSLVTAADVPPWRPVGYYAHPPIRESSGLAVSRTHDGVYWTINDSGNPADLYATSLDGSLIREMTVEGAVNRDWEALAIDDAGRIWIGGIGNNSRARTDLKVYVLDEPDPRDPDASAVVTATYPYSYPAENVDAEGMFIHAGMPHIISKEAGRAVLYAFTELIDGKPHTLQRVGTLEGGAYRITGASLSDDGRTMAAVTYDRLWIYHSVRPISPANLIRVKPWTMPHDFGVEACAFDGDDLILTNEARSIFGLPRYWYERGYAMPPQGALSSLDLHPDRTTADRGTVSVQPYADAGIPIGGAHVTLLADDTNASVTQTVSVPRDDLWEISAILTRGQGYGRVEMLVDDALLGRAYNCAATENTAGTIATFGKTHLPAGERRITLRLSGHQAGARIGLDGYLIQAASPFARRFMVVGPFARQSGDHIDEPLPPEQAFNITDAYKGIDGREIFWKTADTGASGRLDLLKAFPHAPSVTQAYAYTTVYTENERDAVLLIGADDQVAVWINGTEIHRNNNRGGARPDEETVPCRLRAGWNQVLCRIGQNGGNWALYVRFNDPDGSLRYALNPKRSR